MNNKPNFNINNSCRKMARKVYLQYNEFIPDGFDIHHLDKNPNNNKIENLKAISSKEHHKLHAYKGMGKGRKTPIKIRKKISKGLLNFYSKNTVWNKGIPSMTEYNKKRLRETHWKNHTPKEMAKKISVAKMGHKVSKETKEKIRNTLKGRQLSEIHKKNISKGNFKRWAKQQFKDRKVFDKKLS